MPLLDASSVRRKLQIAVDSKVTNDGNQPDYGTLIGAAWLSQLAYYPTFAAWGTLGGYKSSIVPQSDGIRYKDPTKPGYGIPGYGMDSAKLCDFTTFASSSPSNGDLFGYAGSSDNNNAIYIAFRGTNNVANYFSQIGNTVACIPSICNQVTFCGIDTSYNDGCYIASGFYNAYILFQSNVKQWITSLRGQFPLYKIIFTGHSLGTLRTSM